MKVGLTPGAHSMGVQLVCVADPLAFSLVGNRSEQRVPEAPRVRLSCRDLEILESFAYFFHLTLVSRPKLTVKPSVYSHIDIIPAIYTHFTNVSTSVSIKCVTDMTKNIFFSNSKLPFSIPNENPTIVVVRRSPSFVIKRLLL